MLNFAPIIYIISEFVSLLFIFLANIELKQAHKNKGVRYLKKKRIFLILSFLPFSILFSLRHISVGSDFYNYARMFCKIANNSLTIRESSWLGFGFKWYCLIFNFFFKGNFLVAFAIFNNLTLYFFYKAIIKNSSNIFISFLCFYSFCLHFQIFNQFRQMFAIALTFYNFSNIKNKNFKNYLLINILAGLIHKTSFLMLPFYFVSRIKISKKTLIGYILVGLGCYFGFNIIEKILSGSYYSIYFGSKYDIETSSSVLNFFVRICLLFICILFYKPVKKRYSDVDCLYNLVITCTIFQVLAMKSYIFARITTYFFVYYLLLLPNILEVIKYKTTKKVFVVLSVLFLTLYQYIYYNSSSGAVGGGYDKYYFYWQNVISWRSL